MNFIDLEEFKFQEEKFLTVLFILICEIHLYFSVLLKFFKKYRIYRFSIIVIKFKSILDLDYKIWVIPLKGGYCSSHQSVDC